jgi:mevalonate kinase
MTQQSAMTNKYTGGGGGGCGVVVGVGVVILK